MSFKTAALTVFATVAICLIPSTSSFANPVLTADQGLQYTLPANSPANLQALLVQTNQFLGLVFTATQDKSNLAQDVEKLKRGSSGGRDAIASGLHAIHIDTPAYKELRHQKLAVAFQKILVQSDETELLLNQVVIMMALRTISQNEIAESQDSKDVVEAAQKIALLGPPTALKAQ